MLLNNNHVLLKKERNFSLRLRTRRYLAKIRDKYLRKIKLNYAKIIFWKPVITPDFLVIGAPRSGTTWMYDRLIKHPSVYPSKIKEIHFFDQGIDKGSPFNFSGRSAEWRYYSSYFQNDKTKLNGDFTPCYSIIPLDRIKIIKEKIPGIKIIYSLRNPVDRAWSAARKNIGHYKSKIDIGLSIEILRSFALSHNVLIRGKYKKNILNWEKYFKRDEILYLFFDDIIANPQGQLEKICHFLNIDKNKLPMEKKSTTKINNAQSLTIPDEIKIELHDYYKEDIEFLEKNFNRDLKDW